LTLTRLCGVVFY